jgi:[amino group carrier protein]-lysine/ornithine hydrolase
MTTAEMPLLPAAAQTPAATLIGLVQRFSPSGQEAGAVDWLVQRMQALGFERAFADAAGNAVGIKGGGPRQVLLLGHIDTVPGQIAVRVEGERLYGRGSVDAKGPLAAFVDAAASVQPPDGWQLVVVGACDEERNSVGARYAVSQYAPAYAIIGEPSQWQRVTLGYKGSAWASLTLRRTLAHSASQAQSACEAAFHCWQLIQEWAQRFNASRERNFDQATPTLRAFQSSEDGFEAWASLRVGMRLPPGFTPADWYSQLANLVGEAQVEPLGFPVPAYQGEKNTALVRAFLSGIRSAGGKPGFVLKSGTADLNIVAPAWSCPALAYGPGDSSLDHTPDEHIQLSEYEKAVGVLQAVLAQVTQEDDSILQ